MVLGCGGLGQWALRLLRMVYDKVEIIAVDIDDAKLEMAKKYGADEFILWKTTNSKEENASLVTKNGLINCVLEFSGSNEGIKTAILTLEKNSLLAVISVTHSEIPIDFLDLLLRSITITGVLNYTDQDMSDLIDLIVKHNLKPDNLEFYSLDEINEVLDKFKKGEIKGRAMIKF